MPEIKIIHCFTSNTLYACDAENLREAVEKAVLDDASLVGASLDGASLVGASLDGARLDGASLDGASLDGASLDGARLDGASLVGASLDGARLDGARLVGASLDGARLDGARLDGARLDGASLDGEKLFIAPISIGNLYWPVLITAEYMRIGCQRYKHDEWVAFDNDTINRMHHQAFDFWELWKAPLLSMCAAHKSLADQIKGD